MHPSGRRTKARRHRYIPSFTMIRPPDFCRLAKTGNCCFLDHGHFSAIPQELSHEPVATIAAQLRGERQSLRDCAGPTILRIAGTWWSQTGSNRRHPACKAGALPAELWPRPGVGCQVSDFKELDLQHATAQCFPSQPTWWAWEDLNFRPHAYQARALTN